MATAKENKLIALLAACRPAHWVKNGFVLAPLLFGRKFTDPDSSLRALAAFALFCIVSSAVYLFNDLCDRDQDRLHPVKCRRPIASGRVSSSSAVFCCALLMIVSLLGAWQLGSVFLLMLALYVVIHLAYSLGIKKIVILDVMTIAAGFVLRILAGSAAVAVTPSHWLLLCTVFVALFLGFTKRRAELVADHGPRADTRHVLKDYSTAFLDQLINIVTGATILCYALYTVDTRTQEEFHSRAMLLTLPSVMYGIFRYAYIIYHLNKGESPTRAVLRDVPTIVNVLVWLATALVVIHYGQRLAFLLP